MQKIDRPYYHLRQGDSNSVSLELLKQIFTDYYTELDQKGYLDQWLGVWDDWERYGGLTRNPKSYVLRKLRKDLWPINEKIIDCSEEEILSLIEFVYDHVSKPNDVGTTYNSAVAQEEYRNELNPILKDYSIGLSLSVQGEIVVTEPAGMEFLLQANIPQPRTVNKDVFNTIQTSITKFRRRTSTIEDRKAVVQELVGIFEELQKQKLLSQVLNSKDESSIFDLANRFAIRHREPTQINNYDKDIWLSWMFYYYLSTIHAVLRLIQKQEMILNQSDDLWVQVLDEIKRQNSTAYAYLRLAVPEITKDGLLLTFKFMFHLKRASEPKTKNMINNIVAQVYGKKINTTFNLAKRKPE